MVKILFKVLFSVITTVLNIVLLPINLAVSTMFPSFSNLISSFNTLVYSVFGNGVAYFASILPDNTRSYVLLYLGILVSYYTVSISIHAFVKLFAILRKIKFW